MGSAMQINTSVLPQPPGEGVLSPWRVQSLFIALQWHLLDVVDGTDRGNRIIGMELLPAGGHRADPEYRNGKTSWCGMFVEACFYPLGFQGSLASVGRCLSYGSYNEKCPMSSYRGWTVVVTEHGPQVRRIDEYHEKVGMQRRLWAWNDPDRPVPLPGDILLHQKESGSYHGHVMLTGGVDLEQGLVSTIEGNHSKVYGPSGKRREGIGIRQMPLNDPYLDWLVRPSPLDFSSAGRFATMEAALRQAANIENEEV